MKVSIVLFLVAGIACISVAEDIHYAIKHSGSEGHGQDNKGGKSTDQHLEVSSGKSSKHDQELVKKGQDFKDIHKTSHVEKKGKKSSHLQEDSHKSAKHAAGGTHHGLRYADGKKNKKANYLKGFREKFHKDEEKKHDSFFSNGQKSGEYEVYGKKNSKYSSDSFNKKNKKNHKNSAAAKSGGKAYKSAKGHADSAHKSHQGKGGSQSHRKNSESHGKKSATHGGKTYKGILLKSKTLIKKNLKTGVTQRGKTIYLTTNKPHMDGVTENKQRVNIIHGKTKKKHVTTPSSWSKNITLGHVKSNHTINESIKMDQSTETIAVFHKNGTINNEKHEDQNIVNTVTIKPNQTESTVSNKTKEQLEENVTTPSALTSMKNNGLRLVQRKNASFKLTKRNQNVQLRRSLHKGNETKIGVTTRLSKRNQITSKKKKTNQIIPLKKKNKSGVNQNEKFNYFPQQLKVGISPEFLDKDESFDNIRERKKRKEDQKLSINNNNKNKTEQEGSGPYLLTPELTMIGQNFSNNQNDQNKERNLYTNNENDKLNEQHKYSVHENETKPISEVNKIVKKFDNYYLQEESEPQFDATTKLTTMDQYFLKDQNKERYLFPNNTYNKRNGVSSELSKKKQNFNNTNLKNNKRKRKRKPKLRKKNIQKSRLKTNSSLKEQNKENDQNENNKYKPEFNNSSELNKTNQNVNNKLMRQQQIKNKQYVDDINNNPIKYSQPYLKNEFKFISTSDIPIIDQHFNCFLKDTNGKEHNSTNNDNKRKYFLLGESKIYYINGSKFGVSSDYNERQRNFNPNNEKNEEHKESDQNVDNIVPRKNVYNMINTTKNSLQDNGEAHVRNDVKPELNAMNQNKEKNDSNSKKNTGYKKYIEQTIFPQDNNEANFGDISNLNRNSEITKKDNIAIRNSKKQRKGKQDQRVNNRRYYVDKIGLNNTVIWKNKPKQGSNLNKRKKTGNKKRKYSSQQTDEKMGKEPNMINNTNSNDNVPNYSLQEEFKSDLNIGNQNSVINEKGKLYLKNLGEERKYFSQENSDAHLRQESKLGMSSELGNINRNANNTVPRKSRRKGKRRKESNMINNTNSNVNKNKEPNYSPQIEFKSNLNPINQHSVINEEGKLYLNNSEEEEKYSSKENSDAHLRKEGMSSELDNINRNAHNTVSRKSRRKGKRRKESKMINNTNSNVNKNKETNSSPQKEFKSNLNPINQHSVINEEGKLYLNNSGEEGKYFLQENSDAHLRQESKLGMSSELGNINRNTHNNVPRKSRRKGKRRKESNMINNTNSNVNKNKEPNYSPQIEFKSNLNPINQHSVINEEGKLYLNNSEEEEKYSSKENSDAHLRKEGMSSELDNINRNAHNTVSRKSRRKGKRRKESKMINNTNSNVNKNKETNSSPQKEFKSNLNPINQHSVINEEGKLYLNNSGEEGKYFLQENSDAHLRQESKLGMSSELGNINRNTHNNVPRKSRRKGKRRKESNLINNTNSNVNKNKEPNSSPQIEFKSNLNPINQHSVINEEGKLYLNNSEKEEKYSSQEYSDAHLRTKSMSSELGNINRNTHNNVPRKSKRKGKRRKESNSTNSNVKTNKEPNNIQKKEFKSDPNTINQYNVINEEEKLYLNNSGEEGKYSSQDAHPRKGDMRSELGNINRNAHNAVTRKSKRKGKRRKVSNSTNSDVKKNTEHKYSDSNIINQHSVINEEEKLYLNNSGEKQNDENSDLQTSKVGKRYKLINNSRKNRKRKKKIQINNRENNRFENYKTPLVTNEPHVTLSELNEEQDPHPNNENKAIKSELTRKDLNYDSNKKRKKRKRKQEVHNNIPNSDSKENKQSNYSTLKESEPYFNNDEKFNATYKVTETLNKEKDQVKKHQNINRKIVRKRIKKRNRKQDPNISKSNFENEGKFKTSTELTTTDKNFNIIRNQKQEFHPINNTNTIGDIFKFAINPELRRNDNTIINKIRKKGERKNEFKSTNTGYKSNKEESRQNFRNKIKFGTTSKQTKIDGGLRKQNENRKLKKTKVVKKNKKQNYVTFEEKDKKERKMGQKKSKKNTVEKKAKTNEKMDYFISSRIYDFPEAF